MLRSPWRLLGLLLLAGAAGCGIASALTWHEVVLEGAYLNSSSGAEAFAGQFSFDDNATAHILLGAAIGLAVSALLVIGISLRRSGAAPRA